MFLGYFCGRIIFQCQCSASLLSGMVEMSWVSRCSAVLLWGMSTGTAAVAMDVPNPHASTPSCGSSRITSQTHGLQSPPVGSAVLAQRAIAKNLMPSGEYDNYDILDDEVDCDSVIHDDNGGDNTVRRVRFPELRIPATRSANYVIIRIMVSSERPEPEPEAEFLVVLFYKYVALPHPEEVRQWQQGVCERLQLKGRIRVACEGINGTAGGEANNVRRYIQLMKESKEFSDVDFKTSPSRIGPAFPSLRVELKKEIVTLGIDMNELQSFEAAPHLSPEAFAEALTAGDDEPIIIDVRNYYESKLGHFRHAILPPMRQFTEFPTIAKRLIREHNLKEKKVLMYCTGGIRCERASAFMRAQGVRNVFQLKGGIHRFLERYPDGHELFEGKNFVFDERIAIASTAPDRVFGACDVCREPYDDYAPKRRCRACRVLLLLCDKCAAQGRFDESACHPCKASLRQDPVKT